MFYTIYKVTNKINGKYYIGMHKTEDLNDDYMGSGKLIRRSIKKYGIENFSKEILYIFDNEKDMKDKEKELVVISENSYNLLEGGLGGFGYINRTGKNLYGKNGTVGYGSENLLRGKNLIDFLKENNRYEEFRLKLSLGAKKRIEQNGCFWLGRNHSEDTKKKIGLKNSISQKGSKNSQYGTCWITNGRENKKIKKEELDNWLKAGYTKGRKV